MNKIIELFRYYLKLYINTMYYHYMIFEVNEKVHILNRGRATQL